MPDQPLSTERVENYLPFNDWRCVLKIRAIATCSHFCRQLSEICKHFRRLTEISRWLNTWRSWKRVSCISVQLVEIKSADQPGHKLQIVNTEFKTTTQAGVLVLVK